jgi:cation transport regulator ChaB
MAWALKQAGGKPMLAISHHRNERLWATSGDPPRPDAKIDAEKFLKPGEDPGDVTTFEFDQRQLGGEVGKSVAKVWDSNAALPDSVKGSLPDEAQTVFRRVANDRIKAGHSDVSAIKQAWTAVKNGWRKEGDQWVRKIWLGSDGMHEFIEHELFKIKGGEFPYAGDTEGMNVSLHLTPINATDARSPFPYNQYFFANLRDDQKERLLAALTDQDSLPVKRVRLADLSAIQDKIDPEKVQQMVDSPPEKLPVVVRSAPGRYNIADGHHRMTAHLLSGDKTVMARFMDIAPEIDGVIADGNVGSQKEQKRFWGFLAKVNPFRKVAAPEIKQDNQDDDWSSDFVVSKVDQDQQKIFGWASVTMIGDEVVVDKQEDIIPDDELEKAAHDYCLYHRVQGDMHERMGVGRLIESALFNQERWDLGFRHIDPDTGLRKFGWFVGFRVDDPGVWKRIKDGELPEFSIGGKATREAA